MADNVRKMSAEWDVLVTGGFEYLLPHVRHILNAPMHSRQVFDS